MICTRDPFIHVAEADCWPLKILIPFGVNYAYIIVEIGLRVSLDDFLYK